MHNIDRIVWGIFVFCFYDANVISENIDDGPIFPAIFGGESGFLKTLDSGGGLNSIPGIEKFETVNSESLSFNAVETSDHGHLYVGGNFHGHRDTTKMEIQRIVTGCPRCGFEVQRVSVSHSQYFYVRQNISLVTTKTSCPFSLLYMGTTMTASHPFQANSTAAEVLGVLQENLDQEVYDIEKIVEPINTTAGNVQYTWSFVLPLLTACTDDREIETIKILKHNTDSECQFLVTTNSTYTRPEGNFIMQFETSEIRVPWNATESEWSIAATNALGIDQVTVSTEQHKNARQKCGHEWNITFISEMKDFPQISVALDERLSANASVLVHVETLKNGSAIRGTFSMKIGSMQSDPLQYNVSEEALRMSILSSFAAIHDVSVSRAALGPDDSFTWTVSFIHVSQNDTTGIVAGNNVRPIYFNSSLIGGDGVYIFSEEVQHGDFTSGIMAFKNGKWEGLGGGLEETVGEVHSICVEKESSNLAIGGHFQHVINRVHKNVTFVAGERICVAHEYNETVISQVNETQSYTYIIIQNGTNTSHTRQQSVLRNESRVVPHNKTSCSFLYTIVREHTYGEKLNATSLAFWVSESKSWRVLGYNKSLYGVVRALSLGDTSLVSHEKTGTSLYVGGNFSVIDKETNQQEVQSIETKLERISEVHSIQTRSAIVEEIQGVKLSTNSFRNTYRILLDAEESPEIYRVTTEYTSGGDFALVLSGTLICVPSGATASTLQTSISTAIASLRHVTVSRAGPVSNGYSWDITFHKVWNRLTVFVNKFCSSGQNGTDSVGLLGGSATVSISLISSKNIVSGCFGLSYKGNTIEVPAECTITDCANKIRNVGEDIGDVYVLKDPYGFAGGSVIDISLSSLSDPFVTLDANEVVNGSVQCLLGTGASISITKMSNATTVNEIQEIIFSWGIQDTGSYFKIMFRGSISPRINVTSDAASIKGALEEMETIRVVDTEKFGDCAMHFNGVKTCKWAITFVTEGGDVPMITIPSNTKYTKYPGSDFLAREERKGDPYISGFFKLSLEGEESGNIQVDDTVEDFATALLGITALGPESQAVSVEGPDIHGQRSWNITFRKSHLGNIKLLALDSSNLVGSGISLNDGTGETYAIQNGIKIAGSFSISFGSNVSRNEWIEVLHNTSANKLRQELLGFPELNNISVSRQGPLDIDGSYVWAITFLENIGIQPLLKVQQNLQGKNATVNVTRIQRGNGDGDNSLFLSIANYTTEKLYSNMTAMQLENALKALPCVGEHLNVTRSGPTSSGAYSWTVTFMSLQNIGNVAPVQVTSGLTIVVNEKVQGYAHQNFIMLDWREIIGSPEPIKLDTPEGSIKNGIIYSIITDLGLLHVSGHLHYDPRSDGLHARQNAKMELSGVTMYNPFLKRFQNVMGGVLQEKHQTYGIVHSMASYNSNLIVGGMFDRAGSLKARNIASFDGSSWKRYGNGVDATIYSVGIDHFGRVLVGGTFRNAGCSEIHGISIWEGKRRWVPLQTGTLHKVNALKIFPSPLALTIDPPHGPTTGGVDIIVYSSFLKWKYHSELVEGEDVSGMFSIQVRGRNCDSPKWISRLGTNGLKCTLPGGSGLKNTVTIQSQGIESSVESVSATFAYDIPVIFSVSAKNIPCSGNARFNVTGENFGSFNPAIKIFVGSLECLQSVWLSNSLVQCVSPPGRGHSHLVSVFVDGQRNAVIASSVNISYAPPEIKLLSPRRVSTTGGTRVFVNGSGFGHTDPGGELSLSIFGKNISTTWYSDSFISFVAPEGVGQFIMVNITLAGVSKSTPVLAYEEPKISKISPTAGNTTGFELMYITGANFGAKHPVSYFFVPTLVCKNSTTNVSKLFFNNFTNGTNFTSNTTARAALNKFGLLRGFNCSKENGTSCNETSFHNTTVSNHEICKKTDPPENTTKDALSVYVGSVEGINVKWLDDSTITFILPPGTGKKIIRVKIAGQMSNGFSFSYTKPSIIAIHPFFGLSTTGGDLLNIYGFNLGYNSTEQNLDLKVTVGAYSRLCTSIKLINSYHITCLTPPGVGKNNSVRVNVSTLMSEIVPYSLVGYNSPILNSIIPDFGPESGETKVCMIGSSLSDEVDLESIQVWFGAYPGNMSSVSLLTEKKVCLNTSYGVGNQTVRIVVGGISSSWHNSVEKMKRKFKFQMCEHGTFTPKGKYNRFPHRPIEFLDSSQRKFDEVCQVCAPGYYSDILGAGVCIPCDIWSYQPEYAATECILCPKHSRTRYSAAISKENCSCVSGFYGNQGGPCEPCPAGGACPGGELSSLPLAAPGYTRSKINNRIFSKCIPEHACEGGIPGRIGQTTFDNDKRKISRPRVGPTSNTGPLKHTVDKRTNCSVACEHQWDGPHVHTTTCRSKLHYNYDNNNNLISTSMTRECDSAWSIGYREGNCTMDCSSGFSDYPCNLTCSSDYREGTCDLHCDSGFINVGIAWNNFTEVCSEGYTSGACSECDKGYYRLMRNCEKCPAWSQGKNAEFFIFFVVVFGLSCFCVLLAWLASSPVPQPTMHIGFGFFQVVASLSRLRIRWLNEQLSIFTFFSGFSFNSQWMAMSCWSNAPLMTTPRLLVAFSLPLAFMMISISSMYFHYVITKLRICMRKLKNKFTLKTGGKYRNSNFDKQIENGAKALPTSAEKKAEDIAMVSADTNERKIHDDEDELEKAARLRRQSSVYTDEKGANDSSAVQSELSVDDIMWRYLHSYCKILCMMHTYVVAQSMEVFSCFIRSDGVIIYKAEPHLECLTEEWQPWSDLAGIGLGVYGIGLPLFIFALIIPRMKGLLGWSMDDEGFRKKYGGVFLHYRVKYAWWEAVAMIYRGLLCAIISAPPTDGSVIGAGSACLLIIGVYSILVGICQPYRDGNGATGFALDMFCNSVLFCGMVTGGIGSLLVELETKDSVHIDYFFPFPPQQIGDLPEYSSAQVLMMLSYLFILSGALGVVAAILNDIVSACGRGQYEKIMKKSKSNAVMMALFPRSNQGLTASFPSLPADVLEDFKADIFKLKSMYDVFHNVAENSKISHNEKRNKSQIENGTTTVVDIGPITLAEIGNIADEGENVVGKQMELFQWVQQGKRREAKWCPAFIVAYDSSNGRHNTRWTTPSGSVEKEWLRLAEETIKVPTMDTAAVVRKSMAAEQDEDIDISEARFSRSAMAMKKRGMKEQRKSDALMDKINNKLSKDAGRDRDYDGYSPAAAKMLEQIDGSRAEKTGEDLGDDSIMIKLREKSKLQTLNDRDKDDSNEDAVMNRLRGRINEKQEGDFGKWNDSKNISSKKREDEESGDDDDPVLAKLKGKVSSPAVSRNPRRGNMTGKVGALKVNINSAGPPRGKPKLSDSDDSEDSGTRIFGKRSSVPKTTNSNHSSSDSDSSDQGIGKQGAKSQDKESSDSDDVGSSSDEKSDSDW